MGLLASWPVLNGPLCPGPILNARGNIPHGPHAGAVRAEALERLEASVTPFDKQKEGSLSSRVRLISLSYLVAKIYQRYI